MDNLVTWVLVGLISGALASALPSDPPRVVTISVVTGGVLSALLGGWACALVAGSSAASFLCSVLTGVLGALAVLAILRHGPVR